MAYLEPEKYPQKYSDRRSKESQNINFQNKIREQAKRLNSMQEYIKLLENKIKKYNPNQIFPITKQNISNQNEISYQELFKKYTSLQQKYNDLYKSSRPKNIEKINIEEYDEPIEYNEEYVKKLKREKEEILTQLKKEIINNDEQRNYIEILKQALESNISKHGLKDKINFLKNKYYQNSEKGDYASIILDLSKLKEKNDILLQEKDKNYKIIENLNQKSEKLENQLSSYNKLNNEYNTLIQNNNELQNEYINLKNKYMEREKDIIDLKEKYLNSTKQNELLSSENINLKSLKKDNLDLARSVSDLGVKINQLAYDNNNLKDYQTRYEILLRENNELKRMNQGLSDENISIQQKLFDIENYIKELEGIDKDNISLKNQLQNLNDNLLILNNEKNKNENYYLQQLKSLTQEKNSLENMLSKQEEYNEEETNNNINSYRNDNKKLYDYTKKLSEDNQKFMLEHKFFTQLIFRILKFHIPNLNAKNIICEMLNLNEKNIEVNVEIQKMEKNLEKIISKDDINYEEKMKIENNIKDLRNQINNIGNKYDILENQLKEYEI